MRRKVTLLHSGHSLIPLALSLLITQDATPSEVRVHFANVCRGKTASEAQRGQLSRMWDFFLAPTRLFGNAFPSR